MNMTIPESILKTRMGSGFQNLEASSEAPSPTRTGRNARARKIQFLLVMRLMIPKNRGAAINPFL
jgi:hypothetical protein